MASRSSFDLLYNWPLNSELLHNNSPIEVICFLFDRKPYKLEFSFRFVTVFCRVFFTLW